MKTETLSNLNEQLAEIDADINMYKCLDRMDIVADLYDELDIVNVKIHHIKGSFFKRVLCN